MRDHEISQRRACRLVHCPAVVCPQTMRGGVDPKTVRRERPSRLPRQSKRSFDERGTALRYIRRCRKCRQALPVRLPPYRRSARTQRYGHDPNRSQNRKRSGGSFSWRSTVSALPGGRAFSETTLRSQAGPRHTHAYAAGGAPQCTVVAGLFSPTALGLHRSSLAIVLEPMTHNGSPWR